MFTNLVRKFTGDPKERLLKRYRDVVIEINAFEPSLQPLSDDALRAKTDEFKRRLSAGESLDDLLPEAFAVVREASRRSTKLRHFDEQMIGGVVLHEGKIAEAKTGEGKTLVATLPLYLNALTGRGVHLVTPNDYLSKVGVQVMGPIYHFLGLSAGVIQNTAGDPNSGSYLFDPSFPSNDARVQNLRPCSRREAYAADITYGTNNEFGFDYLRDNMVIDTSQLVQRELNFAIVDEVDNILIDEARTPLIISGQADEPSSLYAKFAQIVKTLKPSSAQSTEDKEPDGDYVIDEKDRVVYLTERGTDKVERAMGLEEIYSPENSELIPYLDNSLRAWALYHLDKEYILQDDQVIIVDEFTGRLMYGRRFSEGLHQAIEAKEGVKIRRENLTMATITFQNFFRMYNKLGGMTGTASTEAEEFEKIYDLEVMSIPTHRPMVRADYEDLVYPTEEAKFKAIVDEIKARQETQQPVLVGTVAIETSERLSKALKKAGIDHQVLNAKQHEREAEIITQAGRLNTVTIATNMAGRGVDILLGGNPEGMAREQLRREGVDMTQLQPDQWELALEQAGAQAERDRKTVVELGGLFVLGTERHEARRIDNQLRGRSGRQGDPGESRFYLSLEDELMKRFGGDRVKNVMNWAKLPEDEPIEHPWVSGAIGQAQVRVEGYNFDIRKRVLEYDDVVNKQREVIYRQRRDVLAREGMREEYLTPLEAEMGSLIDQFCEDESAPDTWDLDGLYRALLALFPVPESITPETMADKPLDDLEEMLIDGLNEAYERKTVDLTPTIMHRAERIIMLNAMDSHWRRHLTELDVLREGIGLVAIAQRDPLVEYKREAFGMWEALQTEIKTTASRNIFRVQVSAPQTTIRRAAVPTLQQLSQAPQMQAVRPAVAATAMAAAPAAAPARTQASVGGQAAAKVEPTRKVVSIGRNDPCWCGSGKKYKHCHLKSDQGGTA
ncbi:MAG: preprotein translocase subunit SecA [Chloroflexota bacterium]|nr:preprotein translocase subunit SecA [Chloroflexota bacterium]